jgi:hypothetical protein
MKDKIKDTLIMLLYIIGLFVVTGLFISLTEGDLSTTKIGEIVQTLAAIVGLAFFGFIAYMFIVAIYVSIKNYIKSKIREEVKMIIAKEKYLEKKQTRNDDK